MKKLFFLFASVLLFLTACEDNDDTDTGLLAYCATFRALSIIDVTDPERPIEVGRLELEDSGMGLALKGRYIYFMAYNQPEMYIIDVDDDENPVLVGTATLPSSGVEVAISESGYYAFVTTDDHGMCVIDISIPETPSEVGRFETGSYVNGIYLDGETVYLADANSGLFIVDVTDKHSPVSIGNTIPGSSVNSVTKDGDLVWLATTGRDYDLYGGIHTVDVSDPENPEELTYTDLSDCIDVEYADGNLYVLNWGSMWENGGLHIFAAGEDPVLLGSYTPSGFSPNQVKVRNNLAYCAENDGLIILDISDPTAIVQLSLLELTVGAQDVVVGRR